MLALPGKCGPVRGKVMWWGGLTRRKLDYIIGVTTENRRLIKMAWADIKGRVDELKAKYIKLDEDLMALRTKMAECMKKDAVDAAEMEAVKADLDAIISDIDDNLHADGM